MHKTPDHVQAAIDECNRLKASFTWSIGTAKIVGIIKLGNKTKKLFMSKTPSDWRAPLKVRCDVRKIINEMRN